MRVVPKTLRMLDGKLRTGRTFTRWDSTTGEALGRRFTETDLDQLVIAHADVLADLLREGELLAADSELRCLGTQIDHVDVLFAEVKQGTHELRRLVLVEDKLLRNVEATRQVLAQVVDYAHHFQRDVEADELEAKVDAKQRAWLAGQRDALERCLASGDLLLVICGDDLQPRLVELAARLLDRPAGAVGGQELALVSMALYRSGKDHLLVPHLVGRVEKAQRQLQIQVTVRDGRAPAVTVTEAAEPVASARGGGKNEEAWFRKWGFPDAVEDCKRVLAALERANVPGLERTANFHGKPKIYLSGTSLERFEVFRVTSWEPLLRDALEIVLSRSGVTKAEREAVKELRAALRKLPGSIVVDRGVVCFPVAEAAKRTDALVAAVRRFADRLQVGAERRR